jgi:hypothetical protein
MSNDVFISYSSKDKTTANAACETLEARGIRCWIAPRDILPGEEYATSLVRALRDSRIMVLIFSSSSDQSQQVLREVERAVSKGMTILPLRIEDIAPCAAMEYYISSRHWLDAFIPPLDHHLDHLTQTVQALLARPPADTPAHAGEKMPAPGPAAGLDSGNGQAEHQASGVLSVASIPIETGAVAKEASRLALATEHGSSSTPVAHQQSSPWREAVHVAGPRTLGNGALVDEVTVGNLLARARQLDIGTLVMLLGLFIGLLAGVFAGGWTLRGTIGSSTKQSIDTTDPVQVSKQLQDTVVKRPSIQAFEEFLRAAQTKQWAEAYSLLGPSWKEGSDGVTKPDDLASIYRRTIRHDFNYFIPTLVSDNREEYNADITFSDAIPVFPVRDALANSRISTVLQPAQINSLTEELAHELPSDYIVPNEKKSQLSSLIRDYVAQMTLRDVVLRDDMVEVLGKNLALAPIVSRDNFQGSRAGAPKERFFKVVLVKDQGRWLVDSYDSFMVEKR